MRFETRLKSTGVVADITPIIDMVFLLLIFFMVGSQFARPSIEIDLPEASTGAQSQEDALVITLEKSGRVFFEGRETTLANLQQTLKEALRENPDRAVDLRADGDASFRQFVRVMDQARGAGATRLNIEYNPGRGAGP
jgi:biopolymer transport protein ExbD